MNQSELKEHLDFKANQYENPSFIDQDPIRIPHRFSKKEDIEISAFLLATIAWGNRLSILNSGERLMDLFGNDPHEFIMNYKESKALPFVHRTFNGQDFIGFTKGLQHIYKNHRKTI